MKKIELCKILFSLLPFIFFHCIIASECGMQHTAGTWYELKSAGDFLGSKKVKYLAEFHTRCKDGKTYYDENIIRFGLGASKKHCSVWLGYDFIPSNVDAELRTIAEHRPWQQIIMKVTTKKGIHLSSKTKFEERFKEEKCDAAFRLRQRFLMKVTTQKRKIRFVISDEIFFNLNNPDWIGEKTVAENRLSIGFVMPLRRRLSLQIGYVNQLKPSTTQHKMNHVFSIGLIYKQK